MILTPDDATPKAADGLSWDDYISPFEAAQRLHTISLHLEQHDLASEYAEELRLISQRFTRHLNGLEAFTYLLQDVGKALLC